MAYTPPKITTVAGERVVEAIGPATAATSGASMPRPEPINLAGGSSAGNANR